ncbi:hypothetical protein X848_gp15 [Edwardsiella phage PEi21]|uniref:Uncharacterized protein n=1 Tax=Edwardsiella phage PEi21 TaxID=1325372 RepID=N0DPB7_9CAUD|nr:hypothetical protein X848_gp15 [Edwardsiella phage PEi21]BAN16825.1 hypothetical protein [Edwardsiella phage PEi21]
MTDRSILNAKKKPPRKAVKALALEVVTVSRGLGYEPVTFHRWSLYLEGWTY